MLAVEKSEVNQMQRENKSLILLEGFQKLGLIREALKLHAARFSKQKQTDTRADIPAFSEGKAIRAAIEARKAEAYCHAHGILSAPR